MSNKDILDRLINDFSIEHLVDFFEDKLPDFKKESEKPDLPIKGENFSEAFKIGVVDFDEEAKSLVFCAFKSNNNIKERSSKKEQYNIAKKLLQESIIYDGGIFVFYDSLGNFRFSLVFEIPLGKTREFSNFKRFTYYVSKNQTNKTFFKSGWQRRLFYIRKHQRSIYC